MKITEQKQQQIIKEELISSLKELSNNQVEEDLITIISERVSKNIDLKNGAIMHKGTRWLARDILSHLNPKIV